LLLKNHMCVFLQIIFSVHQPALVVRYVLVQNTQKFENDYDVRSNADITLVRIQPLFYGFSFIFPFAALFALFF
jgi:hypothetical protein